MKKGFVKITKYTIVFSREDAGKNKFVNFFSKVNKRGFSFNNKGGYKLMSGNKEQEKFWSPRFNSIIFMKRYFDGLRGVYKIKLNNNGIFEINKSFSKYKIN